MKTCLLAPWPTATLVLLLVAGCSEPRRGQSDAVVPRWRGSADLTLGSLDGEHDQFGAVSGIATGRQGQVFIADAGNNTISVFDSSGRYQFNVGREGSGPGELKGPCCLAVDSAGYLWVHDAFNSRYNRYSVGSGEATLVETRRTASATGALRSKLTFDRDGRLVDVVTRSTPGGRMELVRFHVDSGGTVARVDTIQAPPNDSLGTFHFPLGNTGFGFINQPYGPRFLAAHAPGGGWARAVSSRYLITWMLNGDSGSARTIRRDMIGPALSARERQVADSVLRTDAGQAGRAVGDLPFGVPGSKTPVYAIMFDQLGRLWVQLNVGDGENNRADVWDSTGKRVGNAEWPAGIDLRPGFIADGVAWGVRQDSTGVPQAVRVRFR